MILQNFNSKEKIIEIYNFKKKIIIILRVRELFWGVVCNDDDDRRDALEGAASARRRRSLFSHCLLLRLCRNKFSRRATNWTVDGTRHERERETPSSSENAKRSYPKPNSFILGKIYAYIRIRVIPPDEGPLFSVNARDDAFFYCHTRTPHRHQRQYSLECARHTTITSFIINGKYSRATCPILYFI